MRFRSLLACALAVASISFIAADARASVVQYSDRTAFNSAIALGEQIDFNSLSGFLQPNPLAIGSASFISSNGSGLYNTTGFGLPGTYLASQNSGYIRIELVSGISAVGFDAASLFSSQAGNWTYELFDATSQIASLTSFVANAFGFVGFVNTSGEIRAINIIGPGSTYEAIDDVSLGTASLVTPLPAALPLFASGLGALGLLGWRRKRKQSAAMAAT